MKKQVVTRPGGSRVIQPPAKKKAGKKTARKGSTLAVHKLLITGARPQVRSGKAPAADQTGRAVSGRARPHPGRLKWPNALLVRCLRRDEQGAGHRHRLCLLTNYAADREPWSRAGPVGRPEDSWS